MTTSKRPTKFGFKHGLIALSALAVVAGWWLLARSQNKSATAALPDPTATPRPQTAQELAIPDLPPIPDVVAPLDLGPIADLPSVQAVAPATTAPAVPVAAQPPTSQAQQAPQVSKPPVRVVPSKPMVTTRSSR